MGIYSNGLEYILITKNKIWFSDKILPIDDKIKFRIGSLENRLLLIIFLGETLIE